MSTKIKVSILFLIILTSICFRIYNINYDDFWIDEMISFWIANPEYSFFESLDNHRDIEQVPFFFNLITKIFFQIFGYHENIARYITAISSILSIIVIMNISRILCNSNAYLFSGFLVGLNIFLISYSQELRVYSVLFLFNSLSILYLFKYLKNKNNFNFIFFFLFTLVSILLHPFSLILICSYFFFSLFLYLNKMKLFKINLSLIFIFLFFILYYSLVYSIEGSGKPSWIQEIDIKFFTNFFFSKFFGSRIVGMIHLVVLFYLIFAYFKFKIKDNNIIFFFIYLTLSYLVPITYSLIFDPVLIARYLIFVLIPIIIIISHITYKLGGKSKNIIIISLIILTVGNMTTEQAIKQFYKERLVHKPQIKKSLNLINNSEFKNFKIKIKKMPNEYPAKETFLNYINYISSKEKLSIKHLDSNSDINSKKFWIICMHDLNENCNTNMNIIKNIKLNRIDVILVN